MKRLALCFCIWKRHELERIIIEHYLRRSKRFGFDIIVCGSEGEKSAQIAKECVYIEHENKPVSDKHNALIQSLKGKDYDGAILIGSDDLIEDKLFEFYQDCEHDYFGFPDMYYWRPKTETLAYWFGNFMGAGRYFSRATLEKMNYTLWRSGINKGLDTSQRTLLESNGIKLKQHSLKNLDSMVVDIKGFGSITDELIVECGLNQNGPQDISELYKRFDRETINAVQLLSASATANR